MSSSGGTQDTDVARSHETDVARSHETDVARSHETDVAHAGGSERSQALGWASAAREVRHSLRDSLGSGRTSLGEVLGAAADDELVGQVKLLWALESLPGARKVDTRRSLAAMGVPEATRLATLDADTIARLLDTFDPRGATT